MGPTMPRYASLLDSGCKFFQSGTNRNGLKTDKKMVTTATDWVHNPHHAMESDSFCLVPEQKINANTNTHTAPHSMRAKNPLLYMYTSTT